MTDLDPRSAGLGHRDTHDTTCTPLRAPPCVGHDTLYLAMFLQPEPEPELPAALPASQPEPQQLWLVVPPDAAGGTGGASAMMDIRQMAFSHSQSHVAVLLAQLGSGGSYFVDASYSALCGLFVAAARDKTASPFVCALIAQATPQQHRMILSELLAYEYGLPALVRCSTVAAHCMRALVTDRCAPEEVAWIQMGLAGHVVELLCGRASSKVVVAYFQARASAAETQFIIDEICRDIKACAWNKHGAAALRVLVGAASPEQMVYFAWAIAEKNLAVNFAKGQTPNYFLQHVLDGAVPAELAQPTGAVYTATIISEIMGQFDELAQNRISSNVVQVCIKHAAATGPGAAPHTFNAVLERLCTTTEEATASLNTLCLHKYANYVMQDVINYCPEAYVGRLAERIKLVCMTELLGNQRPAAARRILETLEQREQQQQEEESKPVVMPAEAASDDASEAA
jgi:hypothetical protein